MLKKTIRHRRPKKTLLFIIVILNLSSTPLFSSSVFSNTVFAKTGSALAEQILQLKKALEQNKKSQAALEDRLTQLEIDAKQNRPATSAIQSSNLLRIGLSGLFSMGQSSVDNSVLATLQSGGHDPNRNGFTVQNVELSFNSTVDNYFDAQANFIFLIDTEGETVVELEEAFFITRSLLWGLQIKGGQYFTEFGRQNPQHPHTWSFVDQPIVLSRLFGGDGLRSQGARVSWLMPTSWYSELTIGGQNAKGETVTSFLSAEGEDVAGYLLGERQGRNFSDLLYSVRWLNSVDFSDNTSMNLGFSGLTGPNASGKNNDTLILGADLYLKWQADYTQRGFPFVSWHTEWLSRRYEAGDLNSIESETLRDSGIFSQLLWGYKPGWIAGLRLEYADAKGENIMLPSWEDPLRNKRKRLTVNLTWQMTEFSRLRLQYNRDWAKHLDVNIANSLWLQMEFSLGSHMAHKF